MPSRCSGKQFRDEEFQRSSRKTHAFEVQGLGFGVEAQGLRFKASLTVSASRKCSYARALNPVNPKPNEFVHILNDIHSFPTTHEPPSTGMLKSWLSL